MVWKRGKQMTCFNESVVRSNTHARRLEHQFTWFHSAKVSWQNHYSRIRICIKMALGKCKLNRISNVRKWWTESRQRSEQIQRFARAHTHSMVQKHIVLTPCYRIQLRMFQLKCCEPWRWKIIETQTHARIYCPTDLILYFTKSRTLSKIAICTVHKYIYIYIAIACNVIALWCNGMFGKQ